MTGYDIMDNNFDPCAKEPAPNFTTPECARKYHGSVVYQLVGEAGDRARNFDAFVCFVVTSVIQLNKEVRVCIQRGQYA